MKYATLTNIVKGEYGRSNGMLLDVFSPLNGEVISQVPLSSADVVDEAVAAAKQAFPKWQSLLLPSRSFV